MTKYSPFIRRTLPFLAAFGAMAVAPAFAATESYSDSAQKMIEQGNLKGAAIELRNAAHNQPQNGDIHLRLAAIYLQIGNIPAAEAEARTALTRGADEAKVAPLLAESLMRSAKYVQLLKEIPAGNRPAASESAVRLFRGLAYLGLHQVQDAAPLIQQAEQMEPGAVNPKLGMSRLLLRQNHPDEAEKKIDEALQLEPHNSRAILMKAEFMRLHGNVDGAIAAYTDVLRREPQNAPAMLGRANMEIAKNALDAAQKDVQTVIAEYPSSGEAQYLQALIYARRGDLKQASAVLEKSNNLLADVPAAMLLSGAVQYWMGQTAQAESNLSRFNARVPNTLAAKLLASIAMKQNQPKKALALLEPFVQAQPKDPAAWAMLADAYVAVGDNGKASQAIDRATALDNKSDMVLDTELAVTRFSSGQTDLGLQQLEDLFGRDGGAPIAGPALVISELRAHHLDAASRAAEQLVQARPNDLVAANLLGLVRVSQGNLANAEGIFSTLYKKHPEFTVAGRNLAQVYMGEGRPDDAANVYRMMLARNNSDIAAHVALADILIATQNYDAAVSELQKAAALDPSSPLASLKIAALYVGQKNWPKAVDTMRPLMQQFANTFDVLDMMGGIQSEMGDKAAAIATYHRAIDSNSGSAVAFDRYANALAANGDWTGARAQLKRAVAIEPSVPLYREELVYAEFKVAGKDSAAALARQLVNANDPPSLATQWMAAVLNKDGKSGEALALLAESERTHPSESITIQHTMILVQSGDAAKGAALLRSWLNGHPNDMAALHALADVTLNAGDYAGAQDALERILAKTPDDVIVLNNLAWIYQRSGDKRAHEVAERAYHLSPLSPAVADTYGWVLLSEGDVQQALPHLRMASYGMPDNPSVQYHLAAALSRAGNGAGAKQILQKVVVNDAKFDGKQQASELYRSLGGRVN